MLKRILLLLVLLIPQFVFANGGTPLMLFSALHLFFGNTLLGIIEGTIVSKTYETPWFKSVLLLILGNYVSWVVGMFFIAALQEFLISALFYLQGVFTAWIISLILLYGLTVSIERPFYNWIFKKEERSKKHSWKLSLWVNALTYIGMMVIYLNVSTFSFFTELKVNKHMIDKPYGVEIMFIKGHQLYQGELKGDFNPELIQTFSKEYTKLALEMAYSKTKHSIDLVVKANKKNGLFVLENFVPVEDKTYYPRIENPYNVGVNVADFRASKDTDWIIKNHTQATNGLEIIIEPDKLEQFSFEMPWTIWEIGTVCAISDSEVLFQIKDRLVLMNIYTKEMTLITICDDFVIRKK